MYGYEVEIYVQDENEPHVSSGVYSLMQNKWEITPSREQFRLDFENIRRKAMKIMYVIDKVEQFFENGEDDEAYIFSSKTKEKIRKFRRCGLESGGLFSSENLAFKALRRNGYLKKLSNLHTKSYDRLMSIKERYIKRWNSFKKGKSTKFHSFSTKKYQI